MDALKNRIIENRTALEYSCGINVMWECWVVPADDERLSSLLGEGCSEVDIIHLMTEDWKPSIP